MPAFTDMVFRGVEPQPESDSMFCSFTAASNRFPLGAKVAVRRLDSDRCAIVVINDRMCMTSIASASLMSPVVLLNTST